MVPWSQLAVGSQFTNAATMQRVYTKISRFRAAYVDENNEEVIIRVRDPDMLVVPIAKP